MGGINVKNTIFEHMLKIIAPHPCSGCGKVGNILCNACKYDIINDPFVGCFLCGAPQIEGICPIHNSPIQRAYIASVRVGTLETVINRLKFEHAKAAARPLAEVLYESLPVLPSDIQLVPIPTVRSHIRQRGYDQVDLITRHLAELTHLPVVTALQRGTNDTQHHVGRTERIQQATKAFSLINGDQLTKGPILLIDDIVTTGSTFQAAAQLLKNAGFTVWVAALAYQPLD